MVDEIPLKSFLSGMMGLLFGSIFVIMGWLDAWIYFSIIIVASLLIVNKNWNLFPVGIIGMFSSGVFTKIGWLDPVVYFSILVVLALILAQQIVGRQTNPGGTA